MSDESVNVDSMEQEPVPALSASLPADIAPDSGVWSSLRRDPVRLAWTVILLSFLLFCLLCIVVVAGSLYAYRNMTVKGDLLLQPTFGTLYLDNPGNDGTIAVTESVSDIGEGSLLMTPRESTQGVLGIFKSSASGGMLNSIQVSSNTVLEIVRMRRPLFAGSRQPHEVILHLRQGQVRVVTLMPKPLSVRMRIVTPQGHIDLADGIFRIFVDEAQTEVDAIDGDAYVRNQAGDISHLREGHRIGITADAVAVHTQNVATELLVNGSFLSPVAEHWQSRVIANDVPPPSMQREFRDGRWVVHFQRGEGDNAHNQFELWQEVGRNVGLNESLFLLINLRIDYQSLPGAGDLSSEFPVRVEIGYTDRYGQERSWGHGFFYLDPLPRYWIENGEQIPKGTWFAYESPDLLSLLAVTPPETVNYVRIHTSGHDYDCYVSSISLIAQ